VHAYAFASDDAAVQSSPQFLIGMIAILERERDQLIPLVVKGPPHLRPLRSRQLKSIEQQLVVAQREQDKLRPELQN
jgi:hypothetical protein